MTGNPNGLSPHDATQLSVLFAQELKFFDTKRVLPAMDGLRSRQKAKLAELGVPNMSGSDKEVR